MSKPTEIPEHIRRYYQLEANDEDEEEMMKQNGGIKPHDSDDEYEMQHGVVKNLLADRNEMLDELTLLDNNSKRLKLFSKIQQEEDRADQELFEKAFIDGEYRKIQKLYSKNRNENGLLDEERTFILFTSFRDVLELSQHWLYYMQMDLVQHFQRLPFHYQLASHIFWIALLMLLCLDQGSFLLTW